MSKPLARGSCISCAKSRTKRGPLRRMIQLLDGGTATKAPLMRLSCGHDVRTNGRTMARCGECAGAPRECKRGHALTPENIYLQNGYKQCAVCKSIKYKTLRVGYDGLI